MRYGFGTICCLEEVPIEKLLFPTSTTYFETLAAAVLSDGDYSTTHRRCVARPDDFVDYLSGIRCLESDAVPFRRLSFYEIRLFYIRALCKIM